jgi:hypothetical protein
MPFRSRQFRHAVARLDPLIAYALGRQLVLSRVPFRRRELLALLARGAESTTPAIANGSRRLAETVAQGLVFKLVTTKAPILAGDRLMLSRLEEDALTDPDVKDAADRFGESA